VGVRFRWYYKKVFVCLMWFLIRNCMDNLPGGSEAPTEDCLIVVNEEMRGILTCRIRSSREKISIFVK
jgi:hypothetical protein